MTSEAINEIKNDEAPEPIINEVIETTNEEQPTEQIKEEEKTAEPIEQTAEQTQPTAKAKPKAQAKKLARSVKVVELVECNDCGKRMLPKSLRNTHPSYCKGQPTETLPVNRQKACYGAKVEEKLRKEIEEEIKKKYETKEVISNSEHEKNETKTRPTPSVSSVPNREGSRASGERQLTATELIQQTYNEMKRLRQQEKQEKINKFRASMF